MHDRNIIIKEIIRIYLGAVPQFAFPIWAKSWPRHQRMNFSANHKLEPG